MLVLKGGFNIMIINAKKIEKKLSIEIPLNQLELQPEKVARYIIALYEFNFIPQNTKCFITAEVENKGLTFCVKPHLDNSCFERTFRTSLYLMPSAAFYDALIEAGLEISETSQMSWEVFKK